ncbi:hypothetical protein GCM10007887_43270 [Methylobacterium haplocladii]|uniref:Uncharacterized protein n=1 Tax=Methylobacterium haplocladii TaxID=1176176 RepID=A0A512IW65_9HYPH|nr:hypothetical protein MHA02_43470 [Methylobacterium haplocladii]GLS61592.1 hypothetical protein GCM10007887_43270 [Methylobacterium haplocladii]
MASQPTEIEHDEHRGVDDIPAEPLATPDPLNPIPAHLPAVCLQQSADMAVVIAPVSDARTTMAQVSASSSAGTVGT